MITGTLTSAGENGISPEVPFFNEKIDANYRILVKCARFCYTKHRRNTCTETPMTDLLEVYARKCGCQTPLVGDLKFTREFVRVSLNLSQGSKRDTHSRPDWCIRCIGKVAVLCVSCRRPIMPGDRITHQLPPPGEALTPNSFRRCTRTDCTGEPIDNKRLYQYLWLEAIPAKGGDGETTDLFDLYPVLTEHVPANPPFQVIDRWTY